MVKPLVIPCQEWEQGFDRLGRLELAKDLDGMEGRPHLRAPCLRLIEARVGGHRDQRAHRGGTQCLDAVQQGRIGVLSGLAQLRQDFVYVVCLVRQFVVTILYVLRLLSRQRLWAKARSLHLGASPQPIQEVFCAATLR